MKNKLLFLLIALIFLLSACDKTAQVSAPQQSAEPSANVKQSAAPSTAAQQKDTRPTASAATEKVSKYSINYVTFTQENISIQYPQISGLGDDAKEKAINKLIKDGIVSKMIMPNDYYKISDLSVDYKSAVTFSTNDLLSVIYTGTSYVKGGAYPTHDFNAITVDLKNAAKLPLTAFMDIDPALVKKIKQADNVKNNSIKDSKDKSILISAVREQSDDVLLSDLKISNDQSLFYLTPDALGIKVSVAHAVGDYALVEIPGQFRVK